MLCTEIAKMLGSHLCHWPSFVPFDEIFLLADEKLPAMDKIYSFVLKAATMLNCCHPEMKEKFMEILSPSMKQFMTWEGFQGSDSESNSFNDEAYSPHDEDDKEGFHDNLINANVNKQEKLHLEQLWMKCNDMLPTCWLYVLL